MLDLVLVVQSKGPRVVGGGELPYETDGDARHLAYECEFWILVSLRVFWAKRQYTMPPRSRLGFRKETQNYARLFFFDDYVFISLKLTACCISVFLSSLF